MTSHLTNATCGFIQIFVLRKRGRRRRKDAWNIVNLRWILNVIIFSLVYNKVIIMTFKWRLLYPQIYCTQMLRWQWRKPKLFKVLKLFGLVLTKGNCWQMTRRREKYCRKVRRSHLHESARRKGEAWPASWTLLMIFQISFYSAVVTYCLGCTTGFRNQCQIILFISLYILVTTLLRYFRMVSDEVVEDNIIVLTWKVPL